MTWVRWLKFHYIPFCLSLWKILPVDQIFTRLFSLLWAPTNFIPLSPTIFDGVALLDMNLSGDTINESVIREWLTSRCTAKIWKQVRRHPFVFQLCPTRSGPKWSISRNWNGIQPCWVLNAVSGVIICLPTAAKYPRHLQKFPITRLTKAPPFTIGNLRIVSSTWDVPTCTLRYETNGLRRLWLDRIQET